MRGWCDWLVCEYTVKCCWVGVEVELMVMVDASLLLLL